MFEELTIRNFALIDSAHLEFTKGFNVLTGETGAGKSILIGALSFLLGGKAEVSQIRAGTTEACVTGTIYIEENQRNAQSWLSDHGIEPENQRILLRRIIKDSGKSSAWIQGNPVTKNELAEFTSHLIDIHGQHEHQSLMKVSEHRKFLDSYAGITGEVEEFTALYTKLVEKRKLLDKMNTSESERAERIDLLKFAIEEIENAELLLTEEDELLAEESRLSQYEKLYGDVENLCDFLLNGDESCVSSIKKARSFIEKAASIDTSLSPISNRIENLFYELDDISNEIRSYKDGLVFDPARLEQIQNRLASIYKLKKKYAGSMQGTIQDVLDYYESAKTELASLSSFEGNKSDLQNELSLLEKEIYIKAKSLSEKRNLAASEMSKKIEVVLSSLGMKGTSFNAGLTVKPQEGDIQKCGPYGFDDIEFLISANVGSPLKPLAKIASGGELSRVMLAFKTIFADSDIIPTLVFDEIDTGIGGEVAVAIGEHIRMLASKHQILCISHLANIAVCADTHIKIKKSVNDDQTTTSVTVISGEQRICEIARMLSGDSASETSLKHAESLLSKYGGI